jgi:hypothetical protein
MNSVSKPLSFILSLLTVSVSLRATTERAKPNVILIMSDDQGWNGLSCQMDSNVPV